MKGDRVARDPKQHKRGPAVISRDRAIGQEVLRRIDQRGHGARSAAAVAIGILPQNLLGHMRGIRPLRAGQLVLLAAHLGTTAEEILDASGASRLRPAAVADLPASIAREVAAASGMTIAEACGPAVGRAAARVGSRDEDAPSAEDLDAFEATLQGREREVFDLRLRDGKHEKLEDIAARWGVSKQRVDQIVRKVRDAARDAGLDL